MRIPSKRKAISPVLATVILIAITLIAAVAIATFVFGIFGTSASPATLSISSASVVCAHTAAAAPIDGVAAANIPASSCVLIVKNTGTTSGSINGAGPGTGSVTFATIAYGTPNAVSGGQVSVPANGQEALVITATSGLVAGQTISAFLTQGNGPNLFFTAVVGS